jgi:hypothetical protein
VIRWGRPEIAQRPVEPQHRPQTPFRPAVILLDDIVEVLARANRDGSQLSFLGPKLAKA